MFQNIFVNLSIISLLFCDLVILKSILPQLEDLLQNFSDLTQRLKENQENGRQSSHQELASAKNIINFGEQLMQQIQPIGKGKFGIVYKIHGFNYKNVHQEEIFAVKEMIYNNNALTNDGYCDQSILLKEILLSRELLNFDLGYQFFPLVFSVYNVTDYFRFLFENSTKSEEMETIFNPPEEKDISVMIMEFLDYGLFEYFKDIRNQKVKSFFHSRLRLTLNIASALLSIDSKYTHCDIKPENIMLKQIDLDQVKYFENKNIYKLQLYPGKYFQVKVIDFGLAAEGEKDSRRCKGGTPDFIPLEFFDGSQKHDKFDLFSLAIMMTDLELNESGLGDFSIFNRIRVDNFRKSDSDQKDQHLLNLPNISFFKQASVMWSDQESHSVFLSQIEKIIPDFQEKQELLDNQDLRQFSLHQIVLKNDSNLFELMLAALRVYWNYFFPRNQQTHTTSFYKNEREKIDVLLDQKVNDTISDEIYKLVELKQYFQDMETLTTKNLDYRIMFLNLLIDIISTDDPEKRSTLENFAQETNKILKSVIEQSGLKINRILRVREYYDIQIDMLLREPKQSLTGLLNGEEATSVKQHFIEVSDTRLLI